MKKYLALIVGLVFVLGFAASAFALHSTIPSETTPVVAPKDTMITIGGELRMRGWYANNISATRRGSGTTATVTPADTNSQAWYDGRLRLGLYTEVTKNTSGYVLLETGSSGISDTYTWGTLNTKQGGPTYLLEAWILHKGSGLLGIPAGMKIGHMPLALSEKQFLDHTKFGDDAIVFFMDPTKEWHIGLLTAKFSEGSQIGNGSNDIDGYVALATYKVDANNTLGFNYAYVSAPSGNLSFQNVGLHGNGKISGWAWQTELDVQFGDQSELSDYDGWGLLLGLGYKFDPVNLRAQFAYGSGDADTDTNDNSEFQTTLGNDVHYTFIYEYTTRGAGRTNYQTVTGNTRSTGIANTTYWRLGADADLMKDLKGSLDLFALRATRVLAGSSKKIGTEVDLKLSYKIDKNLTYSFTAGWLDTAKWWEDTAGVAAQSNKDITQVMHALTLTF